MKFLNVIRGFTQLGVTLTAFNCLFLLLFQRWLFFFSIFDLLTALRFTRLSSPFSSFFSLVPFSHSFLFVSNTHNKLRGFQAVVQVHWLTLYALIIYMCFVVDSLALIYEGKKEKIVLQLPHFFF